MKKFEVIIEKHISYKPEMETVTNRFFVEAYNAIEALTKCYYSRYKNAEEIVRVEIREQ